MGKRVVLGFIIIYIASVIYHEKTDFKNISSDYIGAKVEVISFNKGSNPVVKVYHNNEAHTYFNNSWNKYAFVSIGDSVNIMYQFNKQTNKIQDALFSDFRHRYFSFDKLILHFLILTFTIILISKHYTPSN